MQPPRDHELVRTNETEAAAAARIGARRAVRERCALMGLLRPCFRRTQTWLQAGKYVSALASDLPSRNGWSVAEHAGDRAPGRSQRLLSRACWTRLSRSLRLSGSRAGWLPLLVHGRDPVNVCLVTGDEQDCGAPRVEDEQDSNLAAPAGTGSEFL